MTILTATELSALVTELLPVATLADLRELAAPDHQAQITVQGGTSAGDGDGGDFWYDSSSSTADDGVDYIKPDEVTGNGRWRRIRNDSTIEAGAITNTEISASAAIALSKLATQATYTVVANNTTGTAVPTAVNISDFGAIRTFTTIALLKAGTARYANERVTILGHYSAGDGGGGEFYWDSASSATDNGGTIIAPDAGGVGRWRRIYSGAINLLWFGAKGDSGTTDNTTHIQNALNVLTAGGTLFIPTGKYKVTDEIEVPAVGGLTIQGDGHVDFIHGSPVPTGSGSFIYQVTASKAIFTLAGGASYTRFADLSLSPALVPSNTPDANIIGVKIADSPPDVIWNLTFDRVQFYNFSSAVQAIDPTAGTTAQDFSVAPVKFTQCVFNYPTFGIYLDTNNADDWIVEGSQFWVPSGGSGIYIERAGFLHVKDTISGGASVSTNRFLNIKGDGSGAVDKILLDNVQAETLTQFINLQAGGGYTAYPFIIECQHCIAELGAEIYLGNNVHFISRNSRWSADIYVDDVDVRITTEHDHFDAGANIIFSTGSAETVFYNTIWGPNPESVYSSYTFRDGDLVRRSGTTSVANVTDTTVFTVPDEPAMYAVYGYLPDGGSTYQAVAHIGYDGTSPLVRISTANGAGVEIKVSGLNVQLWQNSGTTQTMGWRFERF